MPRYELSEGTSNKFWEIELDGASFTTRYGRIGSDGQETTKDFQSAAEARKAYDKLVAEKVKKGYELVDGDDDADDHGDGDALRGARNPSLEAAILKDPDNVEGYLVYADWLQTQGDPRGELMAVQAALRTSPADAKLTTRSQELITQHADALLGELGEEDHFHPAWGLGGLHAVTIGDTEEDFGELDGDVAAEMVTRLFRLPAARFLRELTIGLIEDDDGQPNWSNVIGALADSDVSPALRLLRVSCGGYQISWTQLGDLGRVYRKVPRLEELHIKMGAMELGKIELPELRVFEVITGGFTRQNLASVAKAKWPKLERLVLYFGDDNYGGDCTLADLKPIFEAQGLPALRSLGLANSEFANEIAAALPKSKILKQLRELDLSKGTLDDEGAMQIIEHAGAFQHLERLDVSENYLSDAIVARLGKVCRSVVGAGSQGDADADDRYVQVAE